MTHLTLPYAREDAKTVLKAAFEQTDGIKSYHDRGDRIVGKTGMRFASYGETVTVELLPGQSTARETAVFVSADRAVDVNFTANPERYAQRYVASVRSLEEYTVDEILDAMATADAPSKEVRASASSAASTVSASGGSSIQESDSEWPVVVAVTGIVLFMVVLVLAL